MTDAKVIKPPWNFERMVQAIPENAESLYIHVSHRFHDDHDLLSQIKERYGKENVLITDAPSTSGESFVDTVPRIGEERRAKFERPFAEFSMQKRIDSIIYLCNYVCDGYQDPVFPDSVSCNDHIYYVLRLAQKHQKQLIVGYRNRYCFGVSCPERRELTNTEYYKCERKIIDIGGFSHGPNY